MTDRVQLETRWLDLTRRILPALAATRGWPIRADHCFQRVLLDASFGAVWYRHVAGRPAYRAIETVALRRAVDLGTEVADGRVSLLELNSLSLRYRNR